MAVARRYGVSVMFTLSGGHVFPLYDAVVKDDAGPPMRLVDVRHEQTAVFAAEATARLTRTPGLAVVTAGPGVTNSVSAVTTAWFNGAPVVVLAGRAPDYRWGAGSLQEMDHPPLLAPVTKKAWTEHHTARLAGSVDEAFRLATSPHRGPVFLDISLEALYGQAETDLPGVRPIGGDAAARRRAGGADRPIAPNGPASCARARLRCLAGRRRGRGPAGRPGAAPAGDRQRPGPGSAAARSRAAGDPGQVRGAAPGRPGHRGRDAAGLPARVRIVRPEGRPGPGGARGRRAGRDRDARPAGRLGHGRPGRVLHRAGGSQRLAAAGRGWHCGWTCGPGMGAGPDRGGQGRAGRRRAAAGQRLRSGAPGPDLR